MRCGLEIFDDFGTAVAGAINNRRQPIRSDQFR